MRRFGRKLDVEALRASVPIRAFFFDCLFLDGRSIADTPTQEPISKPWRAACPRRCAFSRIVTSSQNEASAFYEAALAAGHEGA